MMGGWFGYGMPAWGWLGMGLMALFWVAVVAVVVWAISTLATARHRDPAEDSAAEILRRRFARGEISQAEFDQAKQTLS